MMARIRTQLDQYRASMDQAWETHKNQLKTIRDYFSPAAGLFDGENPDTRTVNWSLILHEDVYQAYEDFGAGMRYGCCPEGLPWFDGSLRGDDLEFDESKQWNADLVDAMQTMISQSGFYAAIHEAFEELGLFSNCLWSVIPDDPQEVMTPAGPRMIPQAFTVRSYTIGSYRWSWDAKGELHMVLIEEYLTAPQAVELYGDAVSTSVKTAIDQDAANQTFKFYHLTMPGAMAPLRTVQGHPWVTLHWQDGDRQHEVCGVSGHWTMPFCGVTWRRFAGRPYGSMGPGHKAIQANKMVQQFEDTGLLLYDQIAEPVLTGDAGIHPDQIDRTPGSFVQTDQTGAGQIRPAYVPPPAALGSIEAKIASVVDRIQRLFHVDLFRLVSSSAERERTAYEVAQLQEEKLVLLGPMLGRVFGALTKMLERIADMGLRYGWWPDLPDEIEDAELVFEPTSIFARSLKAADARILERDLVFASQLAGLDPAVLDRYDLDKYADVFGDRIGALPETRRDDQTVEAIRQQRAEQQAPRQQMAMQGEAAEIAKTTAEAKKINADANQQMPFASVLRGGQV